jgi:Family of unknown function (DUF6622)
MYVITQLASHTPWWVYLLLVALLQRAIAASRPNVVAVWHLAILPAVFALWDLAAITGSMRVTAATFFGWATPLTAGACLGFLLVRGAKVGADHDNGLIGLAADRTVLPLVLVIFAVKYALVLAIGTHPGLLRNPSFVVTALAIAGLSTGLFVGRFATYLLKYRAARNEALAPSASPWMRR